MNFKCLALDSCARFMSIALRISRVNRITVECVCASLSIHSLIRSSQSFMIIIKLWAGIAHRHTHTHSLRTWVASRLTPLMLEPYRAVTITSFGKRNERTELNRKERWKLRVFVINLHRILWKYGFAVGCRVGVNGNGKPTNNDCIQNTTLKWCACAHETV